eukprot:13472111-Alexandrium_andersonii.AAC.1
MSRGLKGAGSAFVLRLNIAAALFLQREVMQPTGLADHRDQKLGCLLHSHCAPPHECHTSSSA